MATKQKDSVAGKEKHTKRLQPSTTPPGTSAAKDHGKAPTGELKKHVPNYLKPTVSSKPDVAGKHLDTSHNKPNPTTVRRRSLDRHAPPSHVHKAPQSSSSARGERNAAAAAPLKSSSVTVTRNAASSERVSMVVKAVKAQPPLVKVKTLPKVSNVKKEIKSSVLKKAGGSKEEEEEPVNAAAESEAEDEKSLDLNVEEELAKMESHHVDLRHEEHLCEEDDKEEHESPKQHVDADDQEKLISDDIIVSEVEVIKDETQDDQESNQLPDEDDTKKEADADIEEMKTIPDEQVAEKEEHSSSDEKPEAESVVVHKRQVGSKKESPAAYNDVIEETASKLVEKRVNKVRALAGAFETVISLQHPDSS